MQFTEHELTLAADAGARFLFTTRQMPWKRAQAAERWKTMRPAEKYRYRGHSGEIILSCLAELPERVMPGEKPTFTAAEVAAAATSGAKSFYERTSPGGWETLPARKQRRLIGLSLLLTRAAVAALPRRTNPNATPEVPDFVPDDLI